MSRSAHRTSSRTTPYAGRWRRSIAAAVASLIGSLIGSATSNVIGSVAAIAIGLALGNGCAAGDTPHATLPADGITLELLTRSAPLPYMPFEIFAVPAPDRACIFDYYETQLICGEPTWTDLVRAGRKGRGPGELGMLGQLVAAPGGQVAFMDLLNARVSFFTSDLEFVRSTPMRTPLMTPLGSISADWVLGGSTMPSLANPYSPRVLWLDLESGATVREIVLHYEPASPPPEPDLVLPVLETGEGRILAHIGRERLGWFSATGEFIEFLQLPDFRPTYPNEYDVEEYTGNVFWKLTGRTLSEQEVRDYRAKPLKPFLDGGAGGALQLDRSGRLWIGTTRRGARGSYLDLVRGSDYVGSLEIDDHLLAFQLVDSLLVALVAAREPDEVGLYPKRIDWYRIISP